MKITRMSASVFGIASVALLIVAAAATASASDKLHSLDSESLVPALSSMQTEKDRGLVSSDIADEAGLTKASMRTLGENRDGKYWTALNSTKDVCLVVELSDAADGHGEDAEIKGAACSSPLDFYKFGASLRLQGENKSGLVTHMLPPDTSITPDLAAALKKAGASILDRGPETGKTNQIIVMSLEEADAAGIITVPRDGGDVALAPMTPGKE